MNPVVISVIVPCYNQGKYLAEALDSLLNQTYSFWECFIINDNSTDETENIALNYTALDDRFKYLTTEKKGVSAARNLGVKAASGIYLLPLDADDKVAPTYLEKAIQAFKNDPELTLIYGEAEYFGDRVGRWILPEFSFYNLLFMNMIYCSAIFKKDDFTRVGGFSEEMVHGHEDWDFWLRLLKDGAKVLKLSDVVFYYRIKKVSRTTELKEEEKFEKTQRQLLLLNNEVYSDNLFTILKELEQSKNAREELERQINLIRNSRSQRLLFNIKRFTGKFFK